MRVRSLVLASTIPALLGLALLVPGCSGDGGSAGPGGPPDGEQPVFPLATNPVNLTVTLQPARAASARVTTAGGTLTATADDGTVYTLTLPQDALLADTTVTITPIATVTGLDLTGGRYIGVQLEPDGLELFQPATLRMAPPEGADVGVIGFTAHNGQNVHRSPVSVDPTTLEMPLLHFSTGIGHITLGDAGPGPASDPMPADGAGQLGTALEKLARAERERLRDGQAPDPQFQNKLAAVFDAFWKQVLQGLVTRMQTDCTLFRLNGHVAISWVRSVSLLGLDDVFAQQISQIMDGYIAALENCWTELTEPCVTPENFAAAISVARALALLGVEKDNPVRCGGGDVWQGTVTATGTGPYGRPQTHTTDVTFELEAESTEGGFLFQRWRIRTGTVTWRFEGGAIDNPPGCQVSFPEQTLTLRPADGFLNILIEGETTRYTGFGSTDPSLLVDGTLSCGEESLVTRTAVSSWFSTGSALHVTATSGVISGTYTDTNPVRTHTYQWNFTQGGQAVVAR